MTTTNNNTNKCPKCSSTMTQHPSVVSMPLSSSSQIVRDMKNINVQDQDANFTFKFKSCKKCGYSECYLSNSGNSTV
jgi:predicted nucleic-acid-binding Zn-ribbon protein